MRLWRIAWGAVRRRWAYTGAAPVAPHVGDDDDLFGPISGQGLKEAPRKAAHEVGDRVWVIKEPSDILNMGLGFRPPWLGVICQVRLDTYRVVPEYALNPGDLDGDTDAYVTPSELYGTEEEARVAYTAALEEDADYAAGEPARQRAELELLRRGPPGDLTTHPDLDAEATRAANYIEGRYPWVHRGAGVWIESGRCVVFGNDGYGDDDGRVQREVVLVLSRLKAAGITVQGFGVGDAEANRPWALLVLSWTPELAPTGMVWDCWREANHGGVSPSYEADQRGRPLPAVLGDLRARAKAFCSHLVYPISRRGTTSHAQELIGRYVDSGPWDDPGLRDHLSDVLEAARAEAASCEGDASGPGRDAWSYYHRAAELLEEIRVEVEAGRA